MVPPFSTYAVMPVARKVWQGRRNPCSDCALLNHPKHIARRRLSSNGVEIYYSVLYSMFPLATLQGPIPTFSSLAAK